MRSGFDLLLSALALPRGSGVVFSAMTIGDMPRIAAEHGLVPIPCDIDPRSAAPSVEDLERACTPQTRVAVVAHLFGARMDVAPLARFARQRGILFVEDCAQAYSGAAYRGSPEADVSLFSFGPIKHATALGGGIAVIRDEALLARVRALHDAWPLQPRREHLYRVLKYALLHAASSRSVYGVLARVGRGVGFDLDRIANRLTRAFPGPLFFRRIRRRPCAPLLRTLARRIGQGTPRLEGHARRVRTFLRESGVQENSPGASISDHTFWLVPIAAPDPPRLVSALREEGFAATLGRSFAVVGEGTGVSGGAEAVHRRTVYVPVYPAMPDAEVARLARVVRAALAEGDGGAGLSLPRSEATSLG